MNTMFPTSNFKEVNGRIEMLSPTFFSCGCGSIVSRLSSVLPYVNISSRQLAQAKPSLRISQDWIRQEKLDYIPPLKKHVYGVLIDNKLTDGKHLWVDVNAGAPIEVAKQFRRILNVPEPSTGTDKNRRV